MCIKSNKTPIIEINQQNEYHQYDNNEIKGKKILGLYQYFQLFGRSSVLTTKILIPCVNFFSGDHESRLLQTSLLSIQRWKYFSLKPTFPSKGPQMKSGRNM